MSKKTLIIIGLVFVVGMALTPLGYSGADCLDVPPNSRFQPPSVNDGSSDSDSTSSNEGGSSTANNSTSTSNDASDNSEDGTAITTTPQDDSGDSSSGSGFELSGPSFLNNIAQLLLYLAVAVGILMLIYYVFRWFGEKDFRRDMADLDENDEDAMKTLPIPGLLQRADEEARNGNYRLALRYLYTSVLRHLGRTGVLEYQSTATDWEHLRLLRSGGHQQLYDQLLPVTQTIEVKWYGNEPASLEDFQNIKQAVQPMLPSQVKA